MLAIPSDEPSFVAHDLNRAGSLAGELICSVSTWRGCELPADELPPRDGPVCLGIDIGDVASFTSAAAYWRTGRMEVWTACPADPPLAKRAKHDAAGSLYERAVLDGHLWPLAGRLTPIKPFLERLKRELAGVHVAAVGADRRRAGELRQHLISLSLPWRPVWRGGGYAPCRMHSTISGRFSGPSRAASCGRCRTSYLRMLSPMPRCYATGTAIRPG